MKKLLLAGVAALLITTPAHASWLCGKVSVDEKKITSDHLGEWTIEGFGQDVFIKRKHNSQRFTLEFDKKGAKLNGKRCAEVEDNPKGQQEEREKQIKGIPEPK
jgi:hypothetical protein